VTAPEFGIFARVFPVGTAAEVAAQISEAGFTTTQLNLKVLGVPTLPEPSAWAQLDANAVRDTFAGAGVSVWGLSATYNMCHPDPAVRREGTRRASESIARAAQFGAGFVTLCTGSRDADHMWAAHPDNRLPEAWRDFRTELDLLLEAAQRSRVRLGIEPETGLVVDDSRTMRRLLGELGPDAEHLGVVLDGANLIVGVDREPADVLREAFSELGPHIACVHAKDSRGWDAALAGEGQVDFRLVGRLRAEHAAAAPVIVQDIDAARAGLARRYVEDALRDPADGGPRDQRATSVVSNQ